MFATVPSHQLAFTFPANPLFTPASGWVWIVRLWAFFSAAALPSLGEAGVLMTVSGQASPYLAGMPNGSALPFGDLAPGQSPTQVNGLEVFAGTLFQFRASGSVSYNNSVFNGPDGGVVFSRSAANGISGYTTTANSLLGVFLGPDRPDQFAAPNPLDFSSESSRLFLSLSPALRQVFFIGDGLGAGAIRQTFVAPTGATRLFLAMADGSEWNNNGGSFLVDVSSFSSVPEPVTWRHLALAGLLLLAKRALRRAHPRSRVLANLAGTPCDGLDTHRSSGP